MGCALSRRLSYVAPSRRLSILMGDSVHEDATGTFKAAITEETRCLFTLLEELPASGFLHPKFRIAYDAPSKPLGDDKSTVHVEDGIGVTCWKGLQHHKSPNQDSWFVVGIDEDFSFYAVLDGHGEHGYAVANYVKENLLKLISQDVRFMTREMPNMLKDVFKKMQDLIVYASSLEMFDAEGSGTTVTICFRDLAQAKLTIAHIGDSTAVLAKRVGDRVLGKILTRDHRPDLMEERRRIEEADGFVLLDSFGNHRMYKTGSSLPGLDVSRCFGNLRGHRCGLSFNPEVMELELSDSDEFVLLCTDGVWEFMSAQEAVDHISLDTHKTAADATYSLARESRNRWMTDDFGDVVDDITVLLAYLPKISV